MKKNLHVVAILVTSLASGAALSADISVNPGSSAGTQGSGGQVEFTGSITDTSCNIDSTSASQKVDLGKWAKSYFSGAGTETTKTAFHIQVQGCPDTVKTVSVLFDGSRDTTDSELLAVNGGAKGIAIKLYEDDKSTPIPLGSVSAGKAVKGASEDASTGTANLEFFADYVSTSSSIETGAANGTADFNMVYN